MIPNPVVLTLASLIFPLCMAAQTTQPIDPALQSQLAAIDAVASRVNDLSAGFEQKKYTSLLKKPLLSSGQVRASGPVVRWDTLLPQKVTLYTDGASLRLYYSDQKLLEIYPLEQRLADLLTSPLPRLTVIKEHFNIEPASPGDLKDLPQAAPDSDPTLALRLTPRDDALARHVSRVIVLLDAKTSLALAVRTTDADGDYTDMTFSNVRTNTHLIPQQLDLTIPPDVTISHPMEGAPAGAGASP